MKEIGFRQIAELFGSRDGRIREVLPHLLLLFSVKKFDSMRAVKYICYFITVRQ